VGQTELRVRTSEPLFVAALRGYFEVTLILVIDLGADVNGADPMRVTALFAAVSRGRWELLPRLVELGASFNVWAIHAGDTKTPLIVAASNHNLKTMRCLLERGASIGFADEYGNTALLKSACCGHYLTRQILLEYAAANMEDFNTRGVSVWDKLTFHLQRVREDHGDSAALAALLRVLVLRTTPPHALVQRA
jgi:ankyrin repeat protein